MIHVAVLKPVYLDMLLSGEKTLECRLTRTRVEPHGRIRRGERVYFKESSGPFRATALVDEVTSFDDLDEAGVDAIRAEFGDAIRGPDSYWESKRSAKFAVLIRFRRLEEVFRGPKHPALNGRGWIRVPEESDVYPACKVSAKKKAKPSPDGATEARGARDA